jgi:hypothetical protein
MAPSSHKNPTWNSQQGVSSLSPWEKNSGVSLSLFFFSFFSHQAEDKE